MKDLSYYCDLYLTFLSTQKHYSSHTISNYRRDLVHFDTHFFRKESLSFSALTHKHCRDYLFILEGESLAPRTIARKISCLRSFWTYLMGIELASVNPWLQVSLPRLGKPLPKVLYDEEIGAFLDGIVVEDWVGLRDRLICELLYSTGMRVSELVALECDGIHLSECEILVQGKGKKERIVLFGPSVQSFLKQYLEESSPFRLDDESALFINQRGGRLTTRSVQRMIKHQSEVQGLSKTVTPHMLRHSFATSLFHGGADLKVLQELLGHSSLSTTQIYTHVSQKKLQETYRNAHPRAQQ